MTYNSKSNMIEPAGDDRHLLDGIRPAATSDYLNRPLRTLAQVERDRILALLRTCPPLCA